MYRCMLCVRVGEGEAVCEGRVYVRVCKGGWVWCAGCYLGEW